MQSSVCTFDWMCGRHHECIQCRYVHAGCARACTSTACMPRQSLLHKQRACGFSLWHLKALCAGSQVPRPTTNQIAMLSFVRERACRHISASVNCIVKVINRVSPDQHSHMRQRMVRSRRTFTYSRSAQSMGPEHPTLRA